MSFEDVIKKIFVEDFFNVVSLPQIVVYFGITLIIGMLIFFVYRAKNRNSIYSRDFNITLLVLPIITCAIVLTIKLNAALSLGMIGALSIVRFRNAVKSSIDLLFLFWSISVGIACGGGFYLLAIVLSLVLAIILLIVQLFPNRCSNSLLVINSNSIENENEIMNIVKNNTKSYKVKSKCFHNNCMDLIIEVKGKKINEIVKQCIKIKNIENVNLLLHDGDIRL